jgi:arginase
MNIIYFPHKLGQLKNGLQNSLNILSSNICKPIHIVCCNNSKNNNNNLYKNLNNLYQVNKTFNRKINIGGDHSMAIATISESLNRYPNLKVLWFDAHPDINTYKESKSKNLHGMPLSYLTGLDSDNRFEYLNNKLDFKNLLYIGIRDIDEFEANIIKKYKIKYISPEQLNNNPEKCLQTIHQFIKNDPIHISFDVDCMDPSLIPSTGTPVKNGLKLKETTFILNNLYFNNIVNMDITELNFKIGGKKGQEKSINNFLYLFNNYLE